MRRSGRLVHSSANIIMKENLIKNERKKRERPTEKSEPKEEKKIVEKKEKPKKKLKLEASPFPLYEKPTKEESEKVWKELVKVHGMPKIPTLNRGPGGQVPNVMQAVVRTILSQNTSGANGTRAYKAIEEKYGRMNWSTIHATPLSDLITTIYSGGLANVKAKYIKNLLNDVHSKYGHFSLDHLYDLTDEEAYSELTGYKGVGPKTAGCVLMFCLQRHKFAVDTHIFRISKKLEWIPTSANREQAFSHLNERLPPNIKQSLHFLLIKHGRACKNCAANGVPKEKKAVIQAKDCPLKKYMAKLKKDGEEEKEKEEDEDEDEKEEDDEEREENEEEEYEYDNPNEYLMYSEK